MSNTKSRYAAKRDAGQQMYGPGCCAHKITDAQVRAAKDRAERARPRPLPRWYVGLDADVVL